MSNSSKRYQVFVSSTYEDLIAEREAVVRTLLKCNCIPAGMELFPASNESSWQTIKRIIKDCDLYIVISAGRYGSIHKKTDLSFTEMEFNYAQEIGLPTLAFVHADINSVEVEKFEIKTAKRKKLARFHNKLKQRQVNFWTTPENLALQLFPAISGEIDKGELVGWVRADNVLLSDTAEELRRAKEATITYRRLLDEALAGDPVDRVSIGVLRSFQKLFGNNKQAAPHLLIEVIYKGLIKHKHISNYVKNHKSDLEIAMRGPFEYIAMRLFIKSLRKFGMLKKRQEEWHVTKLGGQVRSHLEIEFEVGGFFNNAANHSSYGPFAEADSRNDGKKSEMH
jgi:hypothetical protein